VKQKPLLMMTLPSSGSTWLADVIVKELGLLAHQKSAEFFQPLTNLPMYEMLARCFGSENPSCMDNIMTMPRVGDFEQAVQKFHEHGYTFCKEVFQFFHTPLFVKHFRVFFLYRSAANTFPPKRLRVLAWYDAIATAIESNIGNRFSKTNLLARSIEAHEWCWEYLIKGYAESYKLPILRYEQITDGGVDDVRMELAQVFDGDDLERVVNGVLASRKPR
jgi:hypothetical protein